ncbi:hypothetical protein BKA56DRAFT_599566 [Ilyonectria sp. MPI-CAGE-AT-0026]|nr:hypothetical protein BKA56DRAFT_599566 [Ilyonectria sp. MPI-CAGE-AT-0026]
MICAIYSLSKEKPCCCLLSCLTQYEDPRVACQPAAAKVDKTGKMRYFPKCIEPLLPDA